MRKLVGWWVAVLALLPMQAGADTYKCRMLDGKIAYMGQLPMDRSAKCEVMFVRKQSVTHTETPPAVAPQPNAGVPAPGQPPAPLKQAPPAPQNAAAANANPSPQMQKSPEDMALEAKRKQQEAADAQKKAEQEKENKLAEQKVKDDNCQKARANMQAYQIGGRISKVNENGERVYLDDNEINQKLAEAREDVSKWCE